MDASTDPAGRAPGALSGIGIERRADPEATRRILSTLPTWFGIDEANAFYVDLASRLPSYLALLDGATIGVALVDRHFPESAELALIAVDAAHRGSGAGRALVAALERDLRADGCRLLEVHTVGPSYDDPGYAETRAFYAALGFLPVHEFEKLEWDGPTLVMVKAL